MPLPALAEKMPPLAGLRAVLRTRQARGQRVVFTNGCFDLLHAGHVALLEAARDLGDVLVVGLNSDASVRRLKGPSRPIVAQGERATVLAALRAVDYVALFDEDTPLALIRDVRPDVLVKGSDWAPEHIVGRDEVESWGGRVATVPVVPGRSSSDIVARILASAPHGETSVTGAATPGRIGSPDTPCRK